MGDVAAGVGRGVDFFVMASVEFGGVGAYGCGYGYGWSEDVAERRLHVVWDDGAKEMIFHDCPWKGFSSSIPRLHPRSIRKEPSRFIIKHERIVKKMDSYFYTVTLMMNTRRPCNAANTTECSCPKKS